MNAARRQEHGYVLIIVLVLLIVLSAAGVYGLQTVEGDLRASSSAVKVEVLAQAAEAGAAERMAEIALASIDAGAALESRLEGSSWQQWPMAAFSNNQLTGYAGYMTSSRPLASVDTRPPPGRQIGSGGQTTLWQVDSVATRWGQWTGSTGVASDVSMGEYQVSVGVSLWSRGGTSYNN
jgi:hypothetical protein